MGVYYSAGFGYGFKVGYDDVPEEFDDDLYEYAEALCHRLGEHGIKASYCMLGNGYGVNEVYAIVGFVHSFEMNDSRTFELKQPGINDVQFMQEYGAEHNLEGPGWYGGPYVY